MKMYSVDAERSRFNVAGISEQWSDDDVDIGLTQYGLDPVNEPRCQIKGIAAAQRDQNSPYRFIGALTHIFELGSQKNVRRTQKVGDRRIRYVWKFLGPGCSVNDEIGRYEIGGQVIEHDDA